MKEKMTKKQIKEYYNDNCNLGDERVVDIDIWQDCFEPYDMYASVITISKYHTVRKTLLREHDGIIFIEGYRRRID